MKTTPIAIALLVSLLLGGAALAQAPSPPQGPHRAPPAFDLVRAAWVLPEGQTAAVASAPGMTLEEFAVVAMVAHEEHKTAAEVEAMRLAAPSWHRVIASLGGGLAETLARGSSRYHLAAMAPPDGRPDEAGDEAIRRLAQIQTLERLTGKGPEVLMKEMESGRDFASLLPVPDGGAARETPSRSPGPRRRGRRGDGPPALEGAGEPPRSSGVVETQGMRPPS